MIKAFSYFEEIEKHTKLFCKNTECKFIGVKSKKESHGREVMLAYIEGMIGHFSLSPDEMTPWSKAKIESKLDITFPDRTRAMALKKLSYAGSFMWSWEITWEKDVLFPDW